MEREFSNYSLHITIPISILVGRAQEIIATFPGNVRAIPVAGENFGQDRTVAKARLQSYALGFLLFNIGGQPKVDGFHTNVYTMVKPQGHIERLPHQPLQKQNIRLHRDTIVRGRSYDRDRL